MTEEDLLQDVRALAKVLRWITYHTRDSRRSDAGFVDLVLVRERIVYAELKTERGRLTAKQEEWRDAIVLAGGEWYCWRPSCWNAGEIERILR